MLKKLIRIAAGISAAIGLLMILGEIGTTDYYIELGVYYPLSASVKPILTGFVLLVPAGIVFRKELWK